MKRPTGGAQLWVLRSAVTVAPVVALLLGGVVGPGPRLWMVIVVAVLAGGWAVFPESAAGVVVLLSVVAWWAGGPDGDTALHPVVIAVAGCLVLAHVAALLASYGPAEVTLLRPLVMLWVRRGLAVVLPVPALLGVAWLLRGDVDLAGAWTTGLVGVMAATVLCALAVRRPREEEVS